MLDPYEPFASFVSLISAVTGALFAQESRIPEFHGFLTQGFAYSDNNNYLGMNTSSGSAGWTEAAVNVNEQVTPKLRIGRQVHTTRLREFGSWKPTVDWALADYKLSQRVGVRVGRVKIRWGLFNDTQDADPGYVWSLLPEPIYAVDWRATDLSQIGAEVYGSLRLGAKHGDLEYSGYYGYYLYASNDGYMQTFREEGLDFLSRPRGITPGFDLRWKTPIRGLKLGGSLMMYNAHGTLVNGTMREPLTYWPTYYAQYDKRKLFLSAQYMTLRQPTYTTIEGSSAVDTTNTHAWFAMGGYRITSRLQVGIYHTRNTLTPAPTPSDPAYRFRDWAISGRYDVNSYFYAKVERHSIDGNGLGFYQFNNPNGFNRRTNLVVAKLGFSF